MTEFLLDSMTQVPAWAHHASGSSGALRYSSRYTPKALTKSEYDYYKANDLHVAFVFEDGADNALKGYAVGKADGEFAMKQMLAAGMPRKDCGLWAADYDPASQPADAADAYADGWGAVWGRENSGPYGGFGTVSRQAGRGYKRLWQTYAWSGNELDKRAQLYQYSINHFVGGVGVDYNHGLATDWGQWDYVKPVADPNHYLWHPSSTSKEGLQGGPYRFTELVNGKVHVYHLDERATVIHYDTLRAEQTKLRHPNRVELNLLKEDCRLLAGRIYAEAKQTPREVKLHLPGAWGPFHRRERYKALHQRAAGQRLH